MVILGVLINETCYKTGRVSTRDFTVHNLQLGSSGSPAKNFHGVGIGPLSKILAVKQITLNIFAVCTWWRCCAGRSWVIGCADAVVSCCSLSSSTRPARFRLSNSFATFFRRILFSLSQSSRALSFSSCLYSALQSTWVHFWKELVRCQFWNRMSHWCHMMVDGAKFLILCKWLKLLRKAGCLQLIQNSAPSTIVWRHYDISIEFLHILFNILYMLWKKNQ